MSVKVMAHIFDLTVGNSTLKSVLIAYGDHAHHDGSGIHPATITVAKKTEYHQRTVQRSVNKLVEMGLLLPDGIHPVLKTNQYKYNWDWGCDRESQATENTQVGDTESPDSDRESLRGDTVPPKPSLTILNHPLNQRFADKWEEWKRFRREKRKPLVPTTEKKQLAMLEKYDLDTAIDMVEQSMLRGWEGIFELKPDFRRTTKPKIPARIESEKELEARRRAAATLVEVSEP